MSNEVMKSDAFQKKVKTMLGLTYLTRAKLDGFNGNHYILKDIYVNSTKNTSQIHYLGWDDPQKIPFYPDTDSYRGATSGSKYNKELLVPNERMIEYDFAEAYTNIMRNYKLPSNVYLENVRFDKEKLLERLVSYDKPQPYKELSTFVFVKVAIEAIAKESTYTAFGSHFQPYKELSTFVFVKVAIEAIAKESTYTAFGSHFQQYRKNLSRTLTVTEIELKLIMDFYDVKALEILETYTFRTRKGLLEDYFEKIDRLKEDEETKFFYKMLRNKIYGTIGKRELSTHEAKIFKFPMYNRAFSSMVAGVFRDRIARYEQKYVNSEYGLVLIKTDGLYFKKEVPEFEALNKKGIVKKKVHVITDHDVKN